MHYLVHFIKTCTDFEYSVLYFDERFGHLEEKCLNYEQANFIGLGLKAVSGIFIRLHKSSASEGKYSISI